MVETQTTEEALLHRVAENIGKRRRALGLTQAQLAERLGVDTETLSRFERGKHSPTLKNLARLAGLLQTTVSDLLAEERQQPSDNSTIISAWLDVLSSADQAFAMDMLKQCCDYLGSRKGAAAPEPVASKSMVTFSDIARAMVCRVEHLEERLEDVMSLIEHGLRVELVLDSGREYVTRASVATLFKVLPAVRDRVVERFPEAAAVEVKAPKIKPKRPVRAPFSEPPARDKRNPQDREEALQMTSETADASVVSLREGDEPAIPRRSGLPTRMGIFRVDMIVELGQLRERLDEVLAVLNEKGVVRLERDSQSLARVNLATVYKLYRYAPEVRDVIVSRYPDCIAQEKEDKKKEKADRKQEEEDLRSSRPRQVRTVSVKKKKKAVPESWDATVEEDQEFSSGIENKSSQED